MVTPDSTELTAGWAKWGVWGVGFAHGFGAFPTAEPWAFLGVGKSLFAVEGAARAGVAQTLQIDYNAGLT